MFSKDSLEGSETLGCLDVANNANDHHWWRLDDGHSLHSLFLVQLGAQLVDITHNVGHTSLVANEGGQVNRLGWVVFGKGLAFTTVSARALFGQETQRTVSGMFKFTMTLVVVRAWLDKIIKDTNAFWEKKLDKFFSYHLFSFSYMLNFIQVI